VSAASPLLGGARGDKFPVPTATGEIGKRMISRRSRNFPWTWFLASGRVMGVCGGDLRGTGQPAAMARPWLVRAEIPDGKAQAG
jgi:hypothetical protein